MPKPLTKPPLYRLTLKADAVQAFLILMCNQKPARVGVGISRPDGRYDVGISMGLLDQLQTASLPKENLSDTLVRIVRKF
jgi:hypothetical protein